MNIGRVLLVNDDSRELSSYARTLSALGYDVTLSSSFEEGARRVETEEFEFAIVGQGSAAFEGRQVLERATERHRRIPILVVAKSVNLHNYLEAMDLGAVDYLERPAPEDVRWVLETQLNRPHNLVARHQAN